MTDALVMFYFVFIDSAIKCVFIRNGYIYILCKCHLPLGSNWPIDVSSRDVLVMWLVSVHATHYNPIVLVVSTRLFVSDSGEASYLHFLHWGLWETGLCFHVIGLVGYVFEKTIHWWQWGRLCMLIIWSPRRHRSSSQYDSLEKAICWWHWRRPCSA